MSKYNKKLMGLEPKTFPKNKQWAIDQDYYHLLCPLDKEWMSKFNNEFYGGKIKKGDPTALHNTDDLRKECYNRNNAANRDTYAIKNGVGCLDFPESIEDVINMTEDDVLDTLEARDQWETFLKYHKDESNDK